MLYWCYPESLPKGWGQPHPAQDLLDPSEVQWAPGHMVSRAWGLGLCRPHGEATGLQLEPQTCQVFAGLCPTLSCFSSPAQAMIYG